MLHARLLRYLDEVARCQSMRQAGERLNVAGSAINRQILALEEELGAKLFERLPHKVVLTAAGEVLIEHVRQTLRGMEQSVGQIEALKGLQWGQVSVGIASGLAGTLVPAIVPRVRQLFSHIKLGIVVMSAPDIVAALGTGALDLGLGFNLPTAGLHILGRKAAPVGAVMAANHPLAARPSVTIDECAAYPLCVAQVPLTLRLRLERAFETAAVPFRPAVETDSIELMRCMALDQNFVTFLSAFDTFRERRAGLLVHVPVPGALADPETIILAGRRKGFSPLAARVGEVFAAALHEAW
ncbi:MAG TPA: LysR family transcriptional regulator [Rhodopila sp.]|nr:LysR family transcriptional regulator [Rhodopila sp.]